MAEKLQKDLGAAPCSRWKRLSEMRSVRRDGSRQCRTPNMGLKRFKGFWGKAKSFRVVRQDLNDQPRSAFRFLMESFMKTREAEEVIDDNRLCFECPRRREIRFLTRLLR